MCVFNLKGETDPFHVTRLELSSDIAIRYVCGFMNNVQMSLKRLLVGKFHITNLALKFSNVFVIRIKMAFKITFISKFSPTEQTLKFFETFVNNADMSLKTR